MSLNRTAGFLRSHRRFLVTVHINIDGDALGAQLALAGLLKKMGKRAICVNDDAIPYGYDFLPGAKAIRRYRRGMKLPDFDAMIVLDCSDLNRCGGVAELARVPVLNIDHHISNSRFGRVNWVEPAACCTCELIYRLYQRLGAGVGRQDALFLYTGILTDTGSFRYSNTVGSTHLIAARLLETGVKPAEVYKQIYASVPFEDLMLLGTILPTMRKDESGRIVWFELPQGLLKGRGAVAFDLSENILNFARSVKGVEVALLFKENQAAGGEVRVNFRSQGKADVNKLAGIFGGGGHRTAAGATVRGKTLKETERLVLSKVEAELNKR